MVARRNGPRMDLPLSCGGAFGALRENIEKAGVPGIAATWAHEVGSARLLLAVAINQRYPGHARQAGHIAAMCHVGAYAGAM